MKLIVTESNEKEGDENDVREPLRGVLIDTSSSSERTWRESKRGVLILFVKRRLKFLKR